MLFLSYWFASKDFKALWGLSQKHFLFRRFIDLILHHLHFNWFPAKSHSKCLVLKKTANRDIFE